MNGNKKKKNYFGGTLVTYTTPRKLTENKSEAGKGDRGSRMGSRPPTTTLLPRDIAVSRSYRRLPADIVFHRILPFVTFTVSFKDKYKKRLSRMTVRISVYTTVDGVPSLRTKVRSRAVNKLLYWGRSSYDHSLRHVWASIHIHRHRRKLSTSVP